MTDVETVFFGFWRNVLVGDGCWEHQGYPNPRTGYIQVSSRNRPRLAHRVAWEISHGDLIPKGLVVDHLCGNRICVRPDHLEAVTQRENLRRSKNQVAIYMTATECLRGHSFSEDNTYHYRGKRICKACQRIRDQRFKERRKIA